MSSPPPLSFAGNDAIALQYRFPSEVREQADGVGALAWRTGQGPFGQTTIASQNSRVSAVQWLASVLSPQECSSIVATARATPRIKGGLDLVADSERLSHITWIEPEPENHWLYHKLGSLFSQLNRQYGFDLVGFVDALQFIEHGPGERADWHMDVGPEQSSLRKLSLVLQLSHPDDYDGGELEFVGLPPVEQGRMQGSATAYPAFLGHRVRPVTRGTRCSLVAWGSGQPFR
jgi:PKHD-type hydroxylase